MCIRDRRLFLSLACAGWQGYGDHVERSIALMAALKEELGARGWTIANDSQLAVLCIVPPPGYPDVRTLVNRVIASGHAWMAAAKLEGRDVVRICLTHGEATPQDIFELVGALSARE